MLSQVMELVTFKTNPQVSPEAFIKASETVSEWVRTQPGFQSRTLSRNEDGTWADVVLWHSAGEAHAASEKLMAEMGTSDFMVMIDAESIHMQHLQVVLSI